MAILKAATLIEIANFIQEPNQKKSSLAREALFWLQKQLKI